MWTRQENSYFSSAAVQAILDGGAFKHVCVCWCGGLKDSLSVGREGRFMQQCCQHNLNLCHGMAMNKPVALSCDILEVLAGQASRLCIADVVVSLLVTRRKHNNLATSSVSGAQLGWVQSSQSLTGHHSSLLKFSHPRTVLREKVFLLCLK